MMPQECQNCGAGLNDGWTLCASCRHDYSRTLHSLRLTLHNLRQVANREVRLERRTGHSKSSAPSTPIDLTAFDLLDATWSRIGEIAATINLWGTGDRLLTCMQSRIMDLSRTPTAGHDLRTLGRLLDHARSACERPHAKPFVGRCPECGHDIEADHDETIRRCECGAILDLTEIRHATLSQYRLQNITRTPAQAAEWVRRETGINVPRNTISQWIHRGRVIATPIEGGYYRFNIGSLVDKASQHAAKMKDHAVTAA